MVPSGFSGIRGDVGTYFRVTGAASAGEKLRVLLGARGLWALAFYRWGRWIYAETRGSGVLRKLSRVMHAALRDWVQRITRLSLPVQCRVAADVWFGSHDTTRVNPAAIIGEGARFFGGNTLGIGGRGEMRGAPTLGRNVVFGPGAAAVGRVILGDGVTLGANACAARSIQGPGVFLGSPAVPAEGPADRFTPQFEVQG